MEYIPIPNRKPTVIPNQNYFTNNKIYHTKASSYSNIKNIFPNDKKQIIINQGYNQTNYINQIPNNYDCRPKIQLQTDSNNNNIYNKINVMNNFYGNQIINNNINYFSSSRNIKEIKNNNNQIYNNEFMNNTEQSMGSNYSQFNNYNNGNNRSFKYNRVIKLNPNININNINNNIELDNISILSPKSDMNLFPRDKPIERYGKIIKNIDVNIDYQENIDNEKISMKNKNNFQNIDYNDNIPYFDISNFRTKHSELMKMNNVKVLSNSRSKNLINNYTYNNNSMKNIKSISNTNSLRKSSKVKNKICQKIPHNNIKNMKLFPKTVIEYNQLNDDSILNSRSIKKSSSKILNNTKRKNNENEKVQNDEESGINTQLYNTNSFNNKDILTNINSKIKQKNELENEIKSFGSYKNNFPQDDDVGENIDKKIENYKSISQKSTFGKNTSEFKQNMNDNEIKDSNTFSINNSKNNINKEKDINDINHDLNHYQNKNSSKSKKTNIIFKRSKPQSHIMNQTIMFKNYKENKEKNEKNNDKNDLENKINMVKIDKVESKLLNKKFEIKKKILNKSNSNDTMNVSEMSIDDKIMKINDFSDKIKKNFIPVENIKNTKELKDFNETKKIETLNNINNIKINDIITEKKNIPQDKDIKNINYISKIKKITKDKKKQKYTIEKNYFRNCKYKSLAGKDTLGNRKINQDLYLVQINFIDVEGFNLFGVLDGHGENGHKVAAFARDYIISQLASFFKSQNSINLTSIYSLLKKKNFSLIKDIYQQADKELEKQKFNSNFSGTTCVIVFQIAEKLICANVGDSRAILVTTEKSNSEIYKVIELSHDQKPDLPEEKKRIYKMGGIVDQMLDSKGKRNGPFRVWAGKENYPGLSMSRCIGDLKGKKCGLISEPQIIEYEIDEKSKYMVICSDGVWEFSNNEDVMRMGTEFYKEDNIDEFMDKIIKVSEFWWEKEDIMRDDITAVIVFF